LFLVLMGASTGTAAQPLEEKGAPGKATPPARQAAEPQEDIW